MLEGTQAPHRIRHCHATCLSSICKIEKRARAAGPSQISLPSLCAHPFGARCWRATARWCLGGEWPRMQRRSREAAYGRCRCEDREQQADKLRVRAIARRCGRARACAHTASATLRGRGRGLDDDRLHPWDESSTGGVGGASPSSRSKPHLMRLGAGAEQSKAPPAPWHAQAPTQHAADKETSGASPPPRSSSPRRRACGGRIPSRPPSLSPLGPAAKIGHGRDLTDNRPMSLTRSRPQPRPAAPGAECMRPVRALWVLSCAVCALRLAPVACWTAAPLAAARRGAQRHPHGCAQTARMAVLAKGTPLADLGAAGFSVSPPRVCGGTSVHARTHARTRPCALNARTNVRSCRRTTCSFPTLLMGGGSTSTTRCAFKYEARASPRSIASLTRSLAPWSRFRACSGAL